MDDANLAREWRAIHCTRLTRSGHCAVAPTTQDIIALIARVREDEREECAKVCDEYAQRAKRFDKGPAAGSLAIACAAAIRARHVD